MYAWLTSSEGAAIGSWLASIAGIVAIVIALTAYRGEIGRARAERLRNIKRQREAYRRFVAAATQVIGRARDRIAESGILAQAAGNGSMVGMPDQTERLKVSLSPLIDTINGLRLATPFDADIAIALSEASTTIRDLVAAPLGTLPPAVLATMLGEAAVRLDDAGNVIRKRGIMEDAASGAH